MYIQSEYLGNVRTFDFAGSLEKCRINYAYQPFYTDIYAYKCLSLGDYIDLEDVVNEYPEILEATQADPFEILKGVYVTSVTQDNTHTSFNFLLSPTFERMSDTGEVTKAEYGETTFGVTFLNEHLLPYERWYMMILSFNSIQITTEYSLQDNVLLRFNFPFATNLTTTGNLVNCQTYSNTHGTSEINGRAFIRVASTDDPRNFYGISGESESSPRFTGAMTSWSGIENEDNQSGDTSNPDGGGGNYGDETSDNVPHDGVPTVSAVSSGFIKLYHPTLQNLLDFRDYLYSDGFIDNVKKLLNDPLNYIICLMLNATIPTDGSISTIGAGGLSSEVSAPLIANQYKIFDCGSVNIEECYGAFLDYDNLTQVKVYLPFCGEIALDTNIVMHSTLYLKYAVDYLTGNCLARLEVRNNHGVTAEFYFKEGNCACQIPMSGANYASFYTQGFRALLGVGATLGGNPSGLAQTADAVASMHVDRQRVGSISGEHGMLGNYTPYVTIERPAQSFPSGNNALLGRPSNVGGKVNSFSGYTEIEYIKLDGIQATDAELEEIKQLLADGVYI